MPSKVNNAFRRADTLHVFRPSNVHHNLASINSAFKKADPLHIFRPGTLSNAFKKADPLHIFRRGNSNHHSNNYSSSPSVSQPVGGGDGSYNATGGSGGDSGSADSGSIVNPSIPSASSHTKDQHTSQTDYLIPGIIIVVVGGYLFFSK